MFNRTFLIIVSENEVLDGDQHRNATERLFYLFR